MRFFSNFLTIFALNMALSQISAQEAYNPQNTVFAFDFHEVVVSAYLQDRAGKVIEMFKKSPQKISLAGLTLNPFFWYDVYYIAKDANSTDNTIDKIIASRPLLTSYKNDIYQIVNVHIPIEGTLEIIDELKSLGYKIYMASNIGAHSLELMKQRYPRIFERFDGIYYANAEHGHKPEKQFYVGLRKLIDEKEKNNPLILFVDDSQKFIDGAYAADKNIEGILFTSAQQLRQDLEKRSILAPKMHAPKMAVNLNGGHNV